MKYLATKTYRPAGLINDMDRIFNQFYNHGTVQTHRSFAVDIAENADGYLIEADLPGFEAADVDVRVEENLLVIESKLLENTEEKEKADENRSWHVRERKQGTLKRSFVLPEDVNKTAVEAEMKNGVLSVVLKKSPESKPFTVKVRGK